MASSWLFWVFLLSAGLEAQHAKAESFSILSDIDDTVKITNVNSGPDAVVNGVIGERFFAGMSHLYQQWIAAARQKRILQANAPPRLTFLSASPFFLGKDLLDEFEERAFPTPRLILRSITEIPKPVVEYKLDRLRALASENHERLVLVGDDTQADPEIYATFSAEFPDRVLAQYIRAIRNVPLPERSKPFYTAYEIALEEYASGRLDERAVLVVGQVIVGTKKNKVLIPSFAHCPNPLPLPSLPVNFETQAIREMNVSVTNRIKTICALRKS